MALVRMRVKEGKRPLPFNDGERSRLLQPGEPFEAPERYLVEFAGHVEQIDEAGNVVEEPRLASAELAAGLRTMRAHERVTALQEFKSRREEAHQRELADLDAQIEKAEQEAVREAEERRKARAHGHEETAAGEASAAGTPQADTAEPVKEPVKRRSRTDTATPENPDVDRLGQ